jgi:antitoxin component of MazEF toxin-antitoxin module
MKTLALRQIGNSQGVLLEKTVLELIGADEKNTVFALRIENGELHLRPVTKSEQKELIKKAAKGITQEQSTVLKKLAK